MTLEERLEQIGGCGDGNCKVYVRGGQHTNGGCRCFRNDPLKAERVISAHKEEIRRLQASITAERALSDRLRSALERIVGAEGLFAEPASGQHAREIARAALTAHTEARKENP